MIVDNMIRILISIIGVMLISLNISAQKLPTDVKDKKWNSTLSSLVNNYNQKNCPKDVVNELRTAYIRGNGMKEFNLPFSKYKCVPLHNGGNIKLSPKLDGVDNRCITMKSTDGQSMLFLDFLRMSNPVQAKNISHQLIKDNLSADITSNADDIPSYEAHQKNRKYGREDGYLMKYATVHKNDSLTQKSNADAIYVCSFPARNKIGYITYSVNNSSYNTMKEYPYAYKIVMEKQNHSPIYMYLFLTRRGNTHLNDYLMNISNSMRF